MGKVDEFVLPARLGTGFRWLIASSWASNLGDGIAVAAGPLLVASLTDDAFLVSLAALAGWAPPLLFGLFAGALSDRLDRRRIVMVANASRVVVLAALAATLVTGTANVTVALVALGLLATAEVFADNTTATLTPMLVRRDDLALANSRLGTGMITLNQLTGPPIGAALFAAGRTWPFATQAVLVAISVLLVSRIVLPPHGRAASALSALSAGGAGKAGEAPAGVRRDVAEGVRWLIHHGAMRTLALTILIFNVTFGAAWSVLVLYASQRLGLGEVGFGLLTTVSAAGGLLGTGAYGWITRRVSLGNIMRIGLITETLIHLALALTTSPWAGAVIFFVSGAHGFIWGTTAITVRQRAVPTHLQGRVGSVYTLCRFGGLVVGSAIGGALASHFGITTPFWFAFGGSALFVLLLWRQLTRIAHDDAHPTDNSQAAARH